MTEWSIRRYAGTLADARGILAVEKQVFDESPYRADEVQALLSKPGQSPWLAEAAGEVIGFLCGMRLHGLRGPRLEADLIAVLPSWRGRGIATALLTALRRDASGVAELRSVVRPDNHASGRAFEHAGFSPADEACDLLIYCLRVSEPRPLPEWGGIIRLLRSLEEAGSLVALDPQAFSSPQAIMAATQAGQATLLIAEAGGAIVGTAELLEVHTLTYSGLWLESVALAAGWQRAQPALIAAAVEVAQVRGLDKVGCMILQGESPLRASLLAEGFVPLDSYRPWTASPLSAEGGQA